MWKKKEFSICIYVHFFEKINRNVIISCRLETTDLRRSN